MIKSLEINNFRCFHDTKVKNFARINLLGGRNNAGKTILLEALLLANEPSLKSIAFLLGFRRIEPDEIKNSPKRAWDNFFYNRKKDETITITTLTYNDDERKLVMKCDESVENFINYVQKNSDTEEDVKLNFAKSLNNESSTKSVLHLDVFLNNEEKNSSDFIASSEGVMGGRGSEYAFVNSHFIPASQKRYGEELAKEFDEAKYNDLSDILLQAFQIIDASIVKVDTFQLGKSAIYLKRENEDFMPLSLFGDAMKKVADFILRIINNENSVILIDEIENGIHHQNQKRLWEILFDLSFKFNIQIFATSHSEEMIEAYKNVVIEESYQDDARYFEIARHIITNEITVQKIPINVLEEKLVTNKSLRGE